MSSPQYKDRAVDTKKAALGCEGACRTVTQHAFSHFQRDPNPEGGWHVLFKCAECGATRIWGAIDPEVGAQLGIARRVAAGARRAA